MIKKIFNLKPKEINEIVDDPKKMWINIYMNETLTVLTNMIASLTIKIYEIENPDEKEDDQAWFDWKNKEIVVVLSNRKRMYDEKSLLFALYHEILHFVQRHYKRIENRDPKLWNIACDIWINAKLLELTQNLSSILAVPNNIILEDGYENMTEEEIYEKLRNKNNKSNNSENDDQNDEVVDDQKDNKYDDAKDERVEYRFPDGRTVKKNTIVVNNKRITDVKDYDDEDIKAFENAIRRAIINNRKRGLGTSIDALDITLDPFLETDTDMTVVLKRAIKNYAYEGDTRKWTKINPFTRKYCKTPYVTNSLRPKKMVIAVDTSASVSDKELSIINDILRKTAIYFSEFHIIEADTEIKDEKIIRTNYKPLRQAVVSVKGGGGTSHEDVFNKIENMNLRNVSVVLFITDGVSDIEELWSRYTFHKKVPSIFLLTYNTELNIDGAKIIHVNI